MMQANLIVVTGPSGVGKGTLVKALLARHADLFLSVSATTRSPRSGEIEGESYYFLSSKQFQDWIAQGKFLEWAEYAGNFYGTPRPPIEAKIAEGHRVLLEIEVLGARQIRETFPEAQRIFILPPSEIELEKRLRDRGLDSEAAIARRLTKAREELAVSGEFDHQIINNDLETALQELEKLIWG
ncbi:MAG: guanylate kinase [Microcystaceae cyanobacterium]